MRMAHPLLFYSRNNPALLINNLALLFNNPALF